MSNKVSGIKGILGKVALVGAAGTAWFITDSARNSEFQNRLSAIQTRSAKKINDSESLLVAEVKKEQADRKELQTILDTTKNEFSQYKKGAEKRFDVLQEMLQTNKAEVDRYQAIVQATREIAEGIKSEANSLSGKIESLEKGQEAANTRMDNIKSEEQTRIEIYNKRVPSVVQIFFIKPDKSGTEKIQGSLTGSIIKDKQGEYKILSVSHGIQNRIPGTGVIIVLHSSHGTHHGNNLHFRIPHKDSSLIHCLGAPGRDVSVIDIPKDSEGGELLSKLKIEGIPLAPIEKPKVSSAIYGIGRDWSPYPPSTLSVVKREWHGWEFEKTMLVSRGASLKRGDSGGPLLDKHGRLTGIACSIEAVVTTVPVIADKKIVNSIPAETLGAATPEAYFISIPDIHRSFLNIGVDIVGLDRNPLVIRDILNNRPYAVAPPIPGMSFTNILASIPVIDALHWEPYLLKNNK